MAVTNKEIQDYITQKSHSWSATLGRQLDPSQYQGLRKI